MKILKTLCLLTIIPSVFIWGQGSHVLRQSVRIWPAGYDTTGKHWMVYSFYKPVTHWDNEISIGSTTLYSAASNFIRWSCDIGNFNGAVNPWVPGDTIIAFGSVDSVYIKHPLDYGDRINHCGFFWLYSDTVTPTTPETWAPDDTLRVIPKPIVTKSGLGGLSDDTIVIRIPNPRETRRTDQTEYDIMGYLLYADTTGTGTPNAYNDLAKVLKVKFLVTQGVFGDTTTYKILESNLCTPPNIEWPVYFCYKLGARPDTTVSVADTSGYLTYYFSMNSDSIHVLHNVVDVEEGTGDADVEPRLLVSPNPFSGITKIGISQRAASIEINIYDITGQLVKSFGCLSNDQLPFNQVYWNGRDNSGTFLPAGVYVIEVNADGKILTQKVILER